jgi:hypothetical protein
MATERGVATMLKILGRAFAGTVDSAKVETYHAALEDLSDEQLATAAAKVIKTHTGEFIPPPAVIRAAVSADSVLPSDADAVLSKIKALSHYNSNRGMIRPPVAVVARTLGQAVAEAYAEAGAEALFSDNETTASIARQKFAPALTQWVQRAKHGALPAPKFAAVGGGTVLGLLESAATPERAS